MARTATIPATDDLTNTTTTDPATNAAVTTAIVDSFASVTITTTGAANAQTIQDPTDTTKTKRFVVVNNDTSTDSVVVDGNTIAAGECEYFVWDGDAWTVDAGGGGAGDVSKVGTPADNQIGVWTGDGTLEGTAGLTYDGSNLQLTGDIGSTGTRITKGWFTDLQVTNAIAGSVTGNAGTVSTITGLAPDTATTQATQASITTCANLVSIGTITTGVWNAGAVTSSGAVQGTTGVFTAASSLTLGTASSADGGIIYKNATNANTVTIQSGATSGTYALTLPLAQGGASTVLTNNGSGVLSWAAGGSIAWNDTRTNGTGIGLAHTIGASAAAGVQSIVTTLNNTQTNALTVNEVDLGTSSVGHVANLVTMLNLNVATRGYKVDAGTTGTGKCFESLTDTSTGAGFYGITSGGESGGRPFWGEISELPTTNRTRTPYQFEILRRSDNGVLSDDFDMVYFERVSASVTNNMTATGSVVHIENNINQISGTLTDDVDCLKVTQDADSTGIPILMTQNALVSTNFKVVFRESVTGITIWLSDGTTAEGALTGAEGDICLNGGTGAGQMAYCDAAGTNWTDS